MYTTHGYHIPGSMYLGKISSSEVHPCGGPGICVECSDEAHVKVGEAEGGWVTKEGFQEKAQRIVFEYAEAHLDKTDARNFSVNDVYVTWFSKTLKSWKALVSTRLLDGMYYEVTYDGDKRRTYLDAYKKFDNVTIEDGGQEG
jgi:hypothetical protein